MLPELSGARSVAPQAKTFGAMSFLQPIRNCFVAQVVGRLAAAKAQWHNLKVKSFVSNCACSRSVFFFWRPDE